MPARLIVLLPEPRLRVPVPTAIVVPIVPRFRVVTLMMFAGATAAWDSVAGTGERALSAADHCEYRNSDRGSGRY